MGALRRLVCGLLLSVLAATGAAAQGYTIWGLPTATSLTGNEYVALGQNQSGTYHTVKATLSEFLYLASCRAPGALSLGCVYSSTAPAHNFATGISMTGAVTYGQPNFSDLLGTATNAQLQNSSMTIAGHLIALGGVQAIDLSDLTGSVSGVQMPALTGDVTSTAGTVATTIAPNVVTYSKFQQVAASSLVGNPTGATANAQGVTLGSTLAFSGTALQTGAFSGDCTTLSNSFSITCTKTNGVAFSALATTVPGTGVATALGVNVGSAGAFVVNGGALGTPSSGVATNLTGLPILTGVSGLGTNVATALGNAANGTGGFATTDGAATLTNKAISDATNTFSYTAGDTASPATQTYKAKFDRIALATDDSGVDPTGATDSSAGIMRLLVSSRHVKFPCGTYLFSTTVEIPSNSVLDGQGCATINLAAAATADSQITTFWAGYGSASNWAPVFANSDWTAGNTNIAVKGFNVVVPALTGASMRTHVFNFYKTSNALIEGNTITGPGASATVQDAIAMVASSNYKVINNRASGVYNACFDQWWGSHDFEVSGNYCDGTGGDAGLVGVLVNGLTSGSTAATSYNATITRNTVYNAQSTGISVYGLANAGHTACGVVHDAVISDNIVDTVTGYYGIRVGDGQRFTVAHNIVKNTNNSGIAVASSYGACGTSDAVVSGNVLDSVGTGGFPAISVGNGGSDSPYLTTVANNNVSGRTYTYAARLWSGGAAVTMTADISGTTMTATAPSGVIQPGATISGTNVASGTRIVAQLTGTLGGAGTYQVSVSQTVASTTITAANAANSTTITGGQMEAGTTGTVSDAGYNTSRSVHGLTTSPAQGNIGETIAAAGYTSSGSPVSLTTGTWAEVLQFPLTRGRWRCHAEIATAPAGTTTQSNTNITIANTTAASGTVGNGYVRMPFSVTAGLPVSADVTSIITVSAATQTYYANIYSGFAVSTNAAYGNGYCTRLP